MTAGLLLAGAASPSMLYAAEAETAAEAEDQQANDRRDILVTAQRSERTVQPLALSVDPTAGIGSVYTLDQNDIQGLIINTPQDLLRTIPGVAVADLGNGGIANGVTIRGWSFVGDGVSVRTVINGANNNFVTGPNNNGSNDLNILIPEIVGSINVIKGPFDTRYSGNFAYAGTAIFSTLDSVPNRVKLSVGSFGKQRVVATLGNGEEQGPTKFYVAIDAYSSNGYRTNNNDEKVNIIGKITSQISPLDTLKFTAQLYNNVFGQPGYIRSDLVEQGIISKKSPTTSSGKGWRRSQGATLEWEHRDTAFSFDANAYFQHVKQYRSIQRQSFADIEYGNSIFPTNAYEDERYTVGLGFNPWVNFNVGGIESIFRAGAEIRGDFFDTIRAPVFNNIYVEQPTIYNAWTGFFNYTDGTVWNPSVYAELQLKPAPWLKVTGGVRNDWFHYDADLTVYSGTSLGTTTPNLPGPPVGTPAPLTTYHASGWSDRPTLHGGIVISPGAGFTVLGNFGEGISSTNLNATTVRNGVRYPSFYLNPDQKPTKLNTKEAVLKWDSEELGINLAGSVYHTLNQGEIGTDVLTGNPVNLGKSVRKGFDVYGSFRLYDRNGTSLRVSGNYNEVDGRLSNGNRLQGTPPWIAGWTLDAATPVGHEGDSVRLNIQQTFVGGTYLTNGSSRIVLSSSPETGNVYGTGVLRNGDYDRLAFRLSYERPRTHNLRVWVSGTVYSGDRIAEMTTTSTGFFNDEHTVRGVVYRVGNYQAPFRAEAGLSFDF